VEQLVDQATTTEVPKDTAMTAAAATAVVAETVTETVADTPEAVAETETASESASATAHSETEVTAPELSTATEEPIPGEARDVAQTEVDATDNDNTEVTSSEDKQEPAAQTKPAPSPSPEPVAAEPLPKVAAAANTDGINSDGRAINDPRVAPAAVAEVKIETGHPALFSDQVAAAVVPSGRLVPRASNDPRGPASATTTAPAAEPEPEVAAQG
jgi:ribonuclease E